MCCVFETINKHEGEFCVHHKKLIEYGIVTSTKSSHIKVKLDALGLVEDEEYRLIDVYEPVKQGGYSIKKVYMLTPDAFKKCLMRIKQNCTQFCFNNLKIV